MLDVHLVDESEHGRDGDVRGEGENATAITRSVPFSHRSGSRRVNCQATAAADRTSIVESRPNPISAAEDATVPAAIATTASIRL